MIPDITLDGISMLSLGWLRESIDFPTPVSQSESIVVPGRNAPIRFTEALGSVSFQPRSFSITLTMLGNRKRYNQLVSEVVNRFSGRLVKVVCNDDPEVYAIGTLEAAPSYAPLTGKGTLVLSCSDADSYLYHIEETVIVLSGSGNITLNNDYMPVVPTITTTAETAFRWKVGSDTFQKSVSAGTWTFPELELQHGKNTLTVTGSGMTTFCYREGRL